MPLPTLNASPGAGHCCMGIDVEKTHNGRQGRQVPDEPFFPRGWEVLECLKAQRQPETLIHRKWRGKIGLAQPSIAHRGITLRHLAEVEAHQPFNAKRAEASSQWPSHTPHR